VSSKSNGNGAADSVEPDENQEPEDPATAEAEAAEDPMAALAEERDKLKEQLLRTAADFDNFRKRARRDMDDAGRRGREDTLRELLPIIDNLERAVDASESASDVKAVADGVRMVLKQFEDVAGRLNLERVPAIGERFDPSVHDAVQQLESDEHEPGSIVAEIVPGYRIGTRLVRAALVVVARAPAQTVPPNPGDDPPGGSMEESPEESPSSAEGSESPSDDSGGAEAQAENDAGEASGSNAKKDGAEPAEEIS